MIVDITGFSHTGKTTQAVKMIKPNTCAVAFTMDGDIVDRVRESHKTSKTRFDVLKDLAVIKAKDSKLMTKMIEETINHSKFDCMIIDNFSFLTNDDQKYIENIVAEKDNELTLNQEKCTFVLVRNKLKVS